MVDLISFGKFYNKNEYQYVSKWECFGVYGQKPIAVD